MYMLEDMMKRHMICTKLREDMTRLSPPSRYIRAVNKGSNIYIQMIHEQNTRYVSTRSLLNKNYPRKIDLLETKDMKQQIKPNK